MPRIRASDAVPKRRKVGGGTSLISNRDLEPALVALGLSTRQQRRWRAERVLPVAVRRSGRAAGVGSIAWYPAITCRQAAAAFDLRRRFHTTKPRYLRPFLWYDGWTVPWEAARDDFARVLIPAAPLARTLRTRDAEERYQHTQRLLKREVRHSRIVHRNEDAGAVAQILSAVMIDGKSPERYIAEPIDRDAGGPPAGAALARATGYPVDVIEMLNNRGMLDMRDLAGRFAELGEEDARVGRWWAHILQASEPVRRLLSDARHARRTLEDMALMVMIFAAFALPFDRAWLDEAEVSLLPGRLPAGAAHPAAAAAEITTEIVARDLVAILPP